MQRGVRAGSGRAQRRRVEALDALCLDDGDRRQFLVNFAADAEDLAMLVEVFIALQTCAQSQANWLRGMSSGSRKA